MNDKDIFNTNPRYSTTIGYVLGLLLVDGLTTNEQNALGNWLILVGQVILTNASFQGTIESRIRGGIININSKEVKCNYNPLVYDIDKAKEIINKIYPDNAIDIHKLKDIIDDFRIEINKLKE